MIVAETTLADTSKDALENLQWGRDLIVAETCRRGHHCDHT